MEILYNNPALLFAERFLYKKKIVAYLGIL